ncbi:MAG TPA: DPP IV N-terminal domain-containing protein, partial [Pyrinomonadaceae bacterium]|nr:DPP IV N-terminal domain-containing protein [Pyrinomonadaceae bacterium]
MKRCPECRRSYTDETLNFCLDDGAALLEGPSTAEQPTAILSGDPDYEDRATRRLPETTRDPLVPRLSNEAYSAPSLSRKKTAIFATAAAVVALVAGLGFVVYRYKGGKLDPPRSIKLEKVTTDGKTFNGAISPDGKYAVYNIDEGGRQSLWTKQLATGSTVQIVPAAEAVEYGDIRFSPDGNFVTFRKRDIGTVIFTLYQMPALGGPQKKLIEDIDSGVSYSPDGKQFSFIRGNYPEMGESVLAIANADGSGERVLAKRRRPETFVWWPGSAAWAPDGRTVAAVIGGNATGGVPMQVVEVNLEDGAIKPIGDKGWYEIKQIAWLSDKSGILVMGAEKASDYHTQQISLMSYPDGDMRRITTDFNNYLGMSLTADGTTLATVQSTRISNIWITPNADAGRAVQIRAGGTNQEGTDGLAWAPDGRILFYSKARGTDDVWIMNGDGSDAKPLTVDAGTNYDFKVTPDGRYVVFTSERAGAPNIWRMGMDGGNPKQLTFGNSEYGVSVTPDSKWLLFDSTASGTPAIWKVSIDGGESSPVTNHFTQNSEISPDGKFIVCEFRENATAPWRFAIFNIDGGEPLKVFDLPLKDGDMRWTPDGRAISYGLTT